MEVWKKSRSWYLFLKVICRKHPELWNLKEEKRFHYSSRVTENDALRDYFKKKNQVVIVIHGLEMLQLDQGRRIINDKREIDFLIINFSHHYIMDVEVKHLLGTVGGQRHLSPMEVAKNQIKECKEYIEEWFGADISSSWRFIGLVFCKELEQGLNFCTTCQDFVITVWMDSMRKWT